MADQTIDIKFASELEERKKELVREQIDINWVTGTAVQYIWALFFGQNLFN
jgi:hypothetical protein